MSDIEFDDRPMTDQYMTELAMHLGPDWQAGRHVPRTAEEEMTTPSLDEMAAAPGATQVQYEVTFVRIGRHGGRNGSPPPAPLKVWAVTPDGLADHIFNYVQPYLLSGDVEVGVDLEHMRGQILCGLNNGGTFAITEVLRAEGGDL